MRHDGVIMFSNPRFSALSRSLRDRRAFFSRCINAFLFFIAGPSSGDNGRVGEFPSVGELHGVTVGEKFCPHGVLRALGVTALIPRSFSTEARPMLTENVLQELRRERMRGVGDALEEFRCKTIAQLIQEQLTWFAWKHLVTAFAMRLGTAAS